MGREKKVKLEYKPIKGLQYAFVKETPSTTKVIGWHVNIDKIDYQIISAPIPRLYNETSAYIANRSGDAYDLSKPLFKFMDQSRNLQAGVDKLIDIIVEEKANKSE